MGEVVLVNKQKYYALPPLYTTWQLCQAKITSRNRNLLAKMTKNLAINIRFVVIQG